MSLADRNRERAKRDEQRAEEGRKADLLRGFAHNRIYEGMSPEEVRAALVERGATPDEARRILADAQAAMPSLLAGGAISALGLFIMLVAGALLVFVLENGGHAKGIGMLAGFGLVTFVAGLGRFRDVLDRRRKIREKQAEKDVEG